MSAATVSRHARPRTRFGRFRRPAAAAAPVSVHDAETADMEAAGATLLLRGTGPETQLWNGTSDVGLMAAPVAEAPAVPTWTPHGEPGREHGPRYGYHTTAMDIPPQHTRPYVPAETPEPEAAEPEPDVTAEPPAPADIFADLRDLPCLRDAIAATMQRHCRECRTCGRVLPGRDWPERFAAQLAHIASGIDAPSRGHLAGLDDEVSAGTEAAA
jgi:hypothetical protein